MKYLFFLIVTLLLLTFKSCAQPNVDSHSNPTVTNNNQLKNSLLGVISKYKAIVGLSVIELETGDTISINNNIHFAMQSVYKFPLALTVLGEVEKGKISLQQRVLLSKKMLDMYSWSPLKRQNPGSNFYMSVDSLLMYMIAYSDNVACDMLFQLVGGTRAANKFIHKIGFPNIHIKYTEVEMGEKHNRMYLNSTTPVEMTALLKAFYERKILNEANTKHLLNFMTNDSTSHNRLIGNLPSGTIVAHKTGTGSYSDTLINACNDVGIIYMPDGKHLAVVIFVMNAKETSEDTEKLISILTKKIFEYYN